MSQMTAAAAAEMQAKNKPLPSPAPTAVKTLHAANSRRRAAVPLPAQNSTCPNRASIGAPCGNMHANGPAAHGAFQIRAPGVGLLRLPDGPISRSENEIARAENVRSG